MTFYYVQDVYQKNQSKIRKKTGMIPGVELLSEETCSSVNGPGGLEVALSPFGWGLMGQNTLRKLLSSKEHLDWLKIDLNAAKKITVQD